MQVDGHQAGKDIHQFALSFTTFKVHLIFAFSDEVKEHMPHTGWDIVVGVAPSWYIESTSQQDRNRCKFWNDSRFDPGVVSWSSPGIFAIYVLHYVTRSMAGPDAGPMPRPLGNRLQCAASVFGAWASNKRALKRWRSMKYYCTGWHSSIII